jgi:hypothetical protein
MEFRKHWNNEINLQFYASYHHEKDKTGATDIIHWTTEGKHYKVDFITFSRLLGFNGYDRRATELVEYEDVEMKEYQHMYLDGYPIDGKTVYLKPYFYVLNNILRQILYPKVGDSTYLCDDSQKVLDHFGADFQKFSISRYIWNKIHDTYEDPVRGLPYAPYLMHVIEQVSGICFPSDGSNHKLLKISNKISITATKELKRVADVARGKGKGSSTSHSHRAATSPPAAPSRSTSAKPLSSSSSGKSKKPSKFNIS